MNAATEQTTNSTSLSGLKSQCLSFTEVIAQSIANIAPSVGPALGIPLVFATAGNGTWLTYVFATIAVALIGYHINQFARRSASPGCLYTYVADGLGAGAGVISGWGLVLAYLLTGCATLVGFANYTNVLLGYIGLNVPSIILCAICVSVAWYMTYKDIKLSANLMLAFEAISLGLIGILAVVVLAKNGLTIDHAQLSLQGVSMDSIRIGLVLAFFSFVGFESATALGDEAKNPLRNIPKAVIISALFVGVLFVVFSYTEVLGFLGSDTKLNEAEAPLTFLAEKYGMGFMGFFISIGAAISFFSCTVACTTAGARILFTMGRHQILPSAIGQAHEENNTPHIAAGILSIVTFILPAVLLAFGNAPFDIFGWLGTIATLGFLLSYALIVVAAPVFLYKRKELKPANVLIAIVTMVILLIPIVGSVYPLPPYPYSLFPFIFLGWIILSASWFAIVYSVKKTQIDLSMKEEIKLANEQHAKLNEVLE